MTDTLFIHGMSFQASIGCLPWEKKKLQTIVLDIDLITDCQIASLSDEISDTTNYADVVQTIQQLILSKHYHLIEALAATLCDALLKKYSALFSVSIKITKPNALPQVNALGIVMIRHRD